MEAVTAWLDANAGGADLVWLLLAIGGAVCLFAYGVSLFVASATDPVRRRLAEVTLPQGGESRALDLGWLVGPLASFVMPKGSAERDSTQTHLVQAGFRTPQSLRNFYGVEIHSRRRATAAVLVAARWLPQLTTNMIVFFAISPP